MRTYETAHDAKAHVVNDWLNARAHGTDVIVLASRNADIADLSELAHRHLVVAGVVRGPARVVDVDERNREFQAGDEVLFLRNDRRLGVRNGMRATIEQIHPESSFDLTVRTSDQQRVAVPRWCVDQGHLTHGYAMTIHKAQGLTCDTALVYATDDLDRELGYVALSRGRDLNVTYTTGDVQIDIEAHINQEAETSFPLVTSLCGRQDLNLHVFRHQDLNLARLPISPHPRASLLERIGALGIPDGASLHPRS